MQYVDAHWKDPPCHGVNFDTFKDDLNKAKPIDNQN